MFKSRANSVLRLTTPFKVLVQRFTFLALVGTALGLMVVGRADVRFVEQARIAAVDAVAPILDALSRPAATISQTVDRVQGLIALDRENTLLKQQNNRLKRWRNVALQLETENRELQKLLNFVPSSALSFISARVISDSGGAFARSMLINSGSRDGIREGQIAVTGDGLVGRVGGVGQRSSRILLITDINSRIPVVTETSQSRAILAGDNSDRPQLAHLSSVARVSVGERIVTSGHGGAFPPGLPVGQVISVAEGDIRIQPFVDMSRMEYVRAVEFGLDGFLPMARGSGGGEVKP
ncbi:MAG: rod shape-determining protein MreC [Alphaproteobacteria bacterium]|nr:rod shape-determining protein MreC [Alphaproteobacteria bacterium]